jgi:hypothetical protein
MSVSVFVTSIEKTDHRGTIVEASNGGKEGPPFIRFSILAGKEKEVFIGKRYNITIEEAE